jgi:hypothetical protein
MTGNVDIPIMPAQESHDNEYSVDPDSNEEELSEEAEPSFRANARKSFETKKVKLPGAAVRIDCIDQPSEMSEETDRAASEKNELAARPHDNHRGFLRTILKRRKRQRINWPLTFP